VSTTKIHDRVRELTDVPVPSSAVPDPLVLADEDTLVVSYSTVTPHNRDLPSTTPEAAIVVFRQCYAIHLGPPNDEAFASHLLAQPGNRPCSAFEVESSSWLRGLEERNRGHPRHDPQLFQQLRHWVWTFHDLVLECAALSYAALEVQGRPGDLLPRMHALVRSSGR